MGYICKQPNGNFCEGSGSADNFIRWEMTEDEALKLMAGMNYCHCCIEPGVIYPPALEMMKEEMKNPSEKGRFINPFGVILSSITMSNYKTVDEIRQILKQCGYDKWETYMPWDYYVGFEVKKIFDKHFDEIVDEVIENEEMPNDIEKKNPQYVKQLKKKGVKIDDVRKAIDELKAKRSLESFYHLHRNVLKESEDNIICEFYYMCYDVPSLEKKVNRKRKAINDKINEQFTDIEYMEFI